MDKNTKFTIPAKIVTSANLPENLPKSRAFISVFTIYFSGGVKADRPRVAW